MRALRRAVESSWSGEPTSTGRVLALVTAPLSWLWLGATAVRNRLNDRRPGIAVAGLRVISVGNLAVGGTGKTPFAAWIVGRLLERGERPSLILSGYGEDEVLLHRRWHPEVAVMADPRRASALEMARAGGAAVAVLDDGFQHRAVARDLDIVLLAAEHPFPGRLLPRGPYREPAKSLLRADAVVITRRTATPADVGRLAAAVERIAPGALTASVAISPHDWLDVHGRAGSPPEGPVLAVSALARPETFAGALRIALGEGTDIRTRGFPDHHEYTEDDMRRIRAEAEGEGRTIVATEKDAVKMARLTSTPESVRVLRSRIDWDWGEGAMHALLDRVVGSVGA